jgi:hypothetical protein
MRRQLSRLLNLAASKSGLPQQLRADRSLPPDRSQQQQLAASGTGMGTLGGGGGRNALRLEGSDMWSPFSYTSLRRLAGVASGVHTGVVPIRAGQGLVLELSYAGEGEGRGEIRSGAAMNMGQNLVD